MPPTPNSQPTTHPSRDVDRNPASPLDVARAEHTAALEAWIRSRGDKEPAARERVEETRKVLRALEYARL